MATSVLRSIVGRLLGLDANGNLSIANGTVSPQSGVATATSGAATLAALAGKVTSESLTTAQNSFYTLTITNSKVVAADLVFVSVANGTNTQGTPMIVRATPGAGTITIVLQNKHASAEAFNGTLVFSFFVVKP